MIPVFNEERYIEACLASVLDQDYPPDRYEVIVADGGSTDRTRAIVESTSVLHPNVRLIDNPGRTQAHGLNLAILASRGEFIARQDGHAEWSPHHLRRSIELLLETGADNVGGRADGEGAGVMGRAIARAMRSPFGVGGARYRYSTRVEELPMVFPGTFRRTAFERVGLYDEAYPPHEDYELNHRIRQTGGRVLFSPDIPTRYWVRESVPALARQYFRYGRSKVRVARASLGVIHPYHLAAPALVAAIPVAAALGFTQAGTARGRRRRRRVRAGVHRAPAYRPGRARPHRYACESLESSRCCTSPGDRGSGLAWLRPRYGLISGVARRRFCRPSQATLGPL